MVAKLILCVFIAALLTFVKSGCFTPGVAGLGFPTLQSPTVFPLNETFNNDSIVLNYLEEAGNRPLDNIYYNPSLNDYKNAHTSIPEWGIGLDTAQFQRAFRLSSQRDQSSQRMERSRQSCQS